MILASSAEEVGESFAHMAGVPDAEHGTLVAGAFLLVLGRYIACLDLHIDCRQDGRRYTVREGKVNLLTKHRRNSAHFGFSLATVLASDRRPFLLYRRGRTQHEA